MADDDADKPADDANEPKKPSALGPLLALIGVFLIGVVLVFGIFKVIGGAEVAAEEEDTSTTGTDQTPLLDRAMPLDLGDVMVNVLGEGGRRYVKVTVQLWYPKELQQQVEAPEIRSRIIQAAEQRLGTFDLRELNSEFKHATIARAFQDQINKEMRLVYGTVGTDTTYVEEVVVTNVLVQ